MTASDALTGGFADPVFDAQAVFRAVLDALARPGRIVAIAGRTRPPAPLGAAAAAVIATLADEGTPVWLDAALCSEAVRGWIRFHAGAPLADLPQNAVFALVSDPAGMPPLADFAQGTAEYPDRSTTVILAVSGFDGPRRLRLTGPGIDGDATLSVSGLPAGFVAAMAGNRALFPRGIDLILAAPGAIVGLPRTTRIAETG